MPPFDRVVLIFNPNSTGKARDLAEDLRRDLGQRTPTLAVDMMPTDHAGHAIELARAAAGSGRPLVVSVSGDGGYNEVVNGVMQAGNDLAASAVVAAGNANDHRRTTQQRPIAAAIAAGTVSRIDLLRLTAGGTADVVRYAHSYIGLGLTPVVAVDLEKGDKGSLRELATVVHAFARFKPFEIEVQDGSRLRFDSLVFANIAQMAKIATLAEDQGPPDDGQFEVITLKHTAKWRILANRPQGQPHRTRQATQRQHLHLHDSQPNSVADRRRSHGPARRRHRPHRHRGPSPTHCALTSRPTLTRPASSATQQVIAPASRATPPTPLPRSMIMTATSSTSSTNRPAAPDQPRPNDGDPEAAVIVFVPGLGLDARAWQRVRGGLTGETRVVLLPSMGQPAPRGTDLSVQCQAERVLTALPDHRSIILVGHSASSPVVVEAAARSNHVVGLILIGSVTDPRAATWPRMLSQWARTAIHERPQEARILLPQYRQTGTVSMLRGMNAIRRYRTDLALRQLAVPVEILRGQNDRIAPHDWSSNLQRACTGRMTTIIGAAHMVPITHATAVIAAAERIRGVTKHTPPRQAAPVPN